MRGSGTVAMVEAHVSQGGAGAVGDIVTTSGVDAGLEGVLAVTSGADGRVQTLEARYHYLFDRFWQYKLLSSF